MRPLGGSARELALAWGLGALGVLAVVPWLESLAALVPGCGWRALTGLPCPTCGSTRAALALSDGNVAGALAHNPLAVAGLALFVIGGVGAGLAALTRAPLPRGIHRPGGRTVAVGLAVLVVLQWAYLLWRGEPGPGV